MICPYFKNELCTIYETRPLCCRNFPNREEGMYCSTSKCDNDCLNCKDKCCRHIAIKDLTNFIQILDITCDTCKRIYCNTKK